MAFLQAGEADNVEELRNDIQQRENTVHELDQKIRACKLQKHKIGIHIQNEIIGIAKLRKLRHQYDTNMMLVETVEPETKYVAKESEAMKQKIECNKHRLAGMENALCDVRLKVRSMQQRNEALQKETTALEQETQMRQASMGQMECVQKQYAIQKQVLQQQQQQHELHDRKQKRKALPLLSSLNERYLLNAGDISAMRTIGGSEYEYEESTAAADPQNTVYQQNRFNDKVVWM